MMDDSEDRKYSCYEMIVMSIAAIMTTITVIMLSWHQVVSCNLIP